MIPEEIKRLLDSELEADNEVGWELVEAKKVPYKDVVDYVDSAKIPTNFVHKYVWDGKKFKRSQWGNPSLGGTLSINSTGTGWSTGNVTYTDNTLFRYTMPYLNETPPDWREEYKLTRKNEEIQEEE